jgi:hypothetical protein
MQSPFSILAAFSIRQFARTAFIRPFTFSTTCLNAFLQAADGHRLDPVMLGSSVFFSLPRFPVPVPSQRITFSNVKIVLYIGISAAIC